MHLFGHPKRASFFVTHLQECCWEVKTTSRLFEPPLFHTKHPTYARSWRRQTPKHTSDLQRISGICATPVQKRITTAQQPLHRYDEFACFKGEQHGRFLVITKHVASSHMVGPWKPSNLVSTASMMKDGCSQVPGSARGILTRQLES